MRNQINTAIIIPVRLAATRLPNKPLLLIDNEPMVLQVWKRTIESKLGRVIVATDSEEIGKIISNNGGDYCMTSNMHQSGSDRIYEALMSSEDNSDIDYIINLQGDLPNINSKSLDLVLKIIEDTDFDIGTLVAQINDKDEYNNPNIVKAVCRFKENQINTEALDFVRRPNNHSLNNLYHHIGIYSYKREALKKFIESERGNREQELKLEQLRALDNNLSIGATLIDFLPIGVDTHEDLQRVKKVMELK